MQGNEIAYLLRKINNRLKAGADAKLRENDLTFSQSQVLWYIYSNDGSITQKQLQNFLNVSHPTVVGLVKRLENNHFITTETDQKDHRNKKIQLTREALDFQKSLREHKEETDRIMLKDFSDEEKEELVRLLNKLYGNMKDTQKGEM